MKTIRQLREERGWGQRELARRAGVSHVAVWYWEQGQRTPGADQLRALAHAFGVSMDAIDFTHPATQEPTDD